MLLAVAMVATILRDSRVLAISLKATPFLNALS
jgi:hypothetical protein